MPQKYSVFLETMKKIKGVIITKERIGYCIDEYSRCDWRIVFTGL